MNFLNKLFFILVFIFLKVSHVNGNDSIAFIDMDFIIKNSEIGKKTLVSINNLNDKNINELKKKEKILKELENEIVNKKNIVSKEIMDKEVLLFKEKANRFKEDQLKMVENFNNYKKKELDEVFRKISPVINSFIEQKSVKILLDSKNVLIGRADLNLTNEILNEINEKVK